MTHPRFLAAVEEIEETDGGRPVYVGIDLRAIAANLSAVEDRLDDRTICAVLKGDAYGHGIEHVLPALVGKCSHYGIVDNCEASAVRAIDAETPVVRMRVGSSSEIVGAVKRSLNIREMVASNDKIDEVGAIAVRHDARIDLHVSLNTAALGRNGVDVSTFEAIHRLTRTVLRHSNLRLASVGCHLPDAGSSDPTGVGDPSREALERFEATARSILPIVSDAGAELPELSAYSSASSCAFGSRGLSSGDGVRRFDRIGSSLFGLTRNSRFRERTCCQAMHVATRVCDVVHRNHDDTIGYERSYRIQAEEGEEIALIGAGWLTLSRYLQGVGKTDRPMLLMSEHGDRHPLVGRQSMNISTVRGEGHRGKRLRSGDLLYLTTDYEIGAEPPTIADLATIAGSVQPEFVSSALGSTTSSRKFAF